MNKNKKTKNKTGIRTVVRNSMHESANTGLQNLIGWIWFSQLKYLHDNLHHPDCSVLDINSCTVKAAMITGNANEWRGITRSGEEEGEII